MFILTMGFPLVYTSCDISLALLLPLYDFFLIFIGV